jgi:pyruvate kinase
MLVNGATFSLDTNDEPGDVHRVHLPHPEIFEVVEPGNTLLLDDGKVRLQVKEANKDSITTQVAVGG